MAIRDVLAQNASLDNDYGANHGPQAPTNLELTLWFGDPMITPDDTDELADVVPGIEADAVDYPGYVPAAAPNNGTTFPDAAADGAITSIPITFADPTDEWLTQIDHWAWRDADTDVVWDTGAIDPPLVITSSGDGPVVIPTVFHPDSLTSTDL
jgi:hypothetical protein